MVRMHLIPEYSFRINSVGKILLNLNGFVGPQLGLLRMTFCYWLKESLVTNRINSRYLGSTPILEESLYHPILLVPRSYGNQEVYFLEPC